MAVADPLGEGNTSPYHRPSTKRKNDDGTPFKPTRTKRMWTDEETEILKQGLVAYGHNWKQITIDFPQLQRTPVQLKDRARNVRNILMASGQELGVWQPPVKNQQ